MSDPVTVEITRGPLVESRHRVDVCVVDAQGGRVLVRGDVETPVFPRSAVKGIQAIPLVATGAAERLGLTDAELALACASHSGEPAHAETAAAMLAKAGRDVDALGCGCHWPMGVRAARDLAARGERPSALHNNCSGKHAGFVCLACGGLDVDPEGYLAAQHPVQERVRLALETVTGAAHRAETRGIDGCSIPTYAIPLAALALGFARFGTGIGLSAEDARAAARIRAAVAAHPFMVAGTDRFDTLAMEALGARAFVKTGAEGVYCTALPEAGLGIALKCEDGTGRAAEIVMASLLLRFLDIEEPALKTIEKLARPIITNWNGIVVGEMRAAEF